MGTLFLVATPIGNLEDITIRALKTLFTADYILCEDTRITGVLLHEYTKRYAELFDFNNDWKPKLIRFDEQTEQSKVPEVIAILENGESIALVSDAGTPLISDPGYTLVRECKKRSLSVISIPGPSAILTAITSSGLPTASFMFHGYPPEKQGNRVKLFQNLNQQTTHVFYASPHKLSVTLTDVKTVRGDINIVICRELTKVHEEIWRGTITDALAHFSNPKGEFVIIFYLDK